jgi:hypothetical protein
MEKTSFVIHLPVGQVPRGNSHATFSKIGNAQAASYRYRHAPAKEEEDNFKLTQHPTAMTIHSCQHILTDSSFSMATTPQESDLRLSDSVK